MGSNVTRLDILYIWATFPRDSADTFLHSLRSTIIQNSQPLLNGGILLLTFRQSRRKRQVDFSLPRSWSNRRCQEPTNTMAALPPIAPGGPPAPVLPAGLPSWRELFDSADRMFIEPIINYATLSVALFASADAPDILLSRVESLAQRSPVIIALISDEEPERITLLKNPRRFTGSLANPSPLDGLVYGFSGSDSRTLVAVHLPTAAFEISAAYNVVDDPTNIRAGLDALPPDQTFHAYVNAGTPGMTNAGCRRALVLPMEWYTGLAAHPDGIGLKTFYDQFLATMPAADRLNYADAFTWWRHAASRAAGAGARER